MSEPNRIDPELKQQFRQIVISLFIWLCWLVLNMILGVVLDYAFFDDPAIPLWKHLCFFGWFIASFAGMVKLTYKIWKR